MPRMTKKRYAVIGAVAAVALTAGAAFAYWTSAGTGNGSATTGTSSNFVVTVDNVNLADLSPNGPTDTVGFTVKNTNSGVQSVTATSASVTGTSDALCTAADFSVSPTTYANGSLLANETRAGSFTIQMIDTGANQDHCKNATVHLKVDVS